MLKVVWSKWETFWFSPISLYPVGMMRMILCAGLLWMYSIRLSQFDLFFTDAGLLPLEHFRLLLPQIYHSSATFFFANETASWWAHLSYLMVLLLLTLGVVGRVGALIAFFLHLGFIQRNYSVIYGADLFATFWLLYLSLVKHNAYFSVLNFWKRRKRTFSMGLSTIGIRLIQIQLCLCYAYTGIEKLKGDQWWEGTAVWYVLGMEEFMAGDYTYLQNFPLLIGCLTISTLIFEIYFSAAMLSRSVRPFWLAAGVLFHVSTAVFMNLPFFCLVVIVPYLLFLEPETLQKFEAKIVRF